MKYRTNITTTFLLVIFALSLTPAHANVQTIGKIAYAYGDRYAYDRDGNRKALKKGDLIAEKDTLVTKNGRLHIRFNDGGFVSLYKNTEYRIDEYKFKDVGSSEDKSFFSLLKGAARQITGAIGKRYRNNFKFRTSVATIGIRGTGFFTQLCQGDCFDAEGNQLPDGQYVTNNFGTISFLTGGGFLDLAQGQSAFAANNLEKPTQTTVSVLPASQNTEDVDLFDFDLRNGTQLDGPANTGTPIVPPTAMTDSALIFSYDDLAFGGINSFKLGDDASNTITRNSGTSISGFSSAGVLGSPALPTVFDTSGAILNENGDNSTYMAQWSRWGVSTGNLTIDGSNLFPFNDVHIITSDLALNPASYPTDGIGVYTNVLGGTAPTLFIQSTASGTGTIQSAFMDLNFTTGEIVSFRMTLDFSSINGGTVNINDALTGATLISDNKFPITATCPSCGTLNGSTQFQVVGNDASGVIGGFHADDGVGNVFVSGTYLLGGSVMPAQAGRQ